MILARLFATAILSAFPALPLLAAEPPRLAVVDLTAVFEAPPRTARATADLSAARQAARKKFRADSEELKNLLQTHQELLRDGRRTEATAALERAIMGDIARTIREFNATRDYGLTLDKSPGSTNGLPQVVDAPGADDITAEIIARVKQ